MKSPTRFLLAGVAGAVLLAGCSRQEDTEGAEADPAMSGALDDQIMVDPDLTGQSGGAAGATSELPPEQRTPEAIAAARQEAAQLVGGSVQQAPEPRSGGVASLVESAATAAQVAEAARIASTDCSAKAEYSMTWADKLPAALGVYPRGAVQEAAGTDSDGCRLRVVSFITPVQPGDVIDFYYTRVRKAGYDAQHRMDGNDHVLGGKSGKSAYLLYARKRDNGLTEVDLIASGT